MPGARLSRVLVAIVAIMLIVTMVLGSALAGQGY
jgi:hypothetical protein